MAKSKAFAFWVEQILGHLIGLGFLLTLLIGPLSVVVYLVGKLSPWRWLPWPVKGQWPAGRTAWIADYPGRSTWFAYKFQISESKPYQPLDRLIDQRRDLIFQFAGYVVAEIARESWLLWQWQ